MSSVRRGALLLTEMKIQFRGGLYAVYGAMTLFFLLVLVLLPEEFRQRGFEAIVLLDPAFMGFFFAGGLVLLERDQGVISLVVTSAGGSWGGFSSWWVAKAGALLLLAYSVVGALAGVVHLLGIVRIPATGIPYLAVGLALSVPVYFSLGVILAARFTRVLDYFVYSTLVMLPFLYPLVEVGGVSLGLWGVFSPLWGGLVLISSLFEPARSSSELIAAVLSLVLWNGIAFHFASRAFARLAAGGSGGSTGGSTGGSRIWGSGGRRDGGSRDGGSSGGGAVRFSPARAEVTLLLRDPMTRIILVAPILAALVLGRGMPALLFMIDSDITRAVLSHIDSIRSFVILLSAVMYGMLGAFLILDEKDEGLLPLLRTMPGPPGWYILRRGVTLLILFGILQIVLVPAGNLLHGNPAVFIASLAVDATVVLLTFLAMSLLAANKVQGLAMAKVLNVSSLPPLILVALPGSLGLLIGLFPGGWGSLMRLRARTGMEAAVFAFVGFIYAGVIIFRLYRRVLR